MHVAVGCGGCRAERGHAGGWWGRARVAGVQQVWGCWRRWGGAVHIPLVRIFQYVINEEWGGNVFLVVYVRDVLSYIMLRHRGRGALSQSVTSFNNLAAFYQVETGATWQSVLLNTSRNLVALDVSRYPGYLAGRTL